LASKANQAAETLERLGKIRAEQERRALKGSGVGTFIHFAYDLCKIQLTLAQRVIGKVAFDRVQPKDLSPEELEMFHKLFGKDVHEIPPHVYSLYTVVAGVRASKTYIAAIRLLHLALTVDISTLAPGEDGFVFIISTSLANAKQAMRYILGAINTVPGLRSMVVGKPTPQCIRIRRGEKCITIEPRAAAKSGTGSRGFSLLSCLLDEAAMMRGIEYAVSDIEISNSMYTRLMPGGQMIVASSPWVKSGLLWSNFERDFNHPVVGLCAHAPTLTVLDTPRNRLIYEQSKAEDPDRAAREYEAEFVGSEAESFFDPIAIDRSIDPELPVHGYRDPQPGDVVKMGADFGFSQDSSAAAVIHMRGGVYSTAEICEIRPEKDEPLKPSDVVRKFAEVATRHSITYMSADMHYKQAIIETLNEFGISFIDAPKAPSDAYVAARLLLNQGQIRIPKHPRFIAQLREIRSKRDTGGAVRMILPRSNGGHCDIVSAWVLSIWQACGQTMPHSDPDLNTPEGRLWLNEKLREDRRQDKYRDAVTESNYKWWQRRGGRSFQGKQRHS
jgi:hypothetical protein